MKPTSRRLLLAGSCLLFVAFAAYGSFVPFQLQRLSIGEALDRFGSLPAPDPWHSSRTDFLANVLLFVPIGFTLSGALADRSRRAAAVMLPVTTLIALATSVGIELGQVFFSGRTPSWNDVTAETTGALAGAVGWLVAGPLLAEWLRPLSAPSTPLLRARRLLGIYAAVWLVLHLLPFDFTLRLPELAEKFRAGRIVVIPFGDTASPWEAVVAVAGGALQAAPIGALAVIVFSAFAPLVQVLAGCLVIGGTELAQLLAVSRTADTTDLIAGVLGVAGGAYAANRMLANSRISPTARPAERRCQPWALAALAVWMVVLAVRHWDPFDFVLTGAMLDSRIERLFQLPFHSYYWGNYIGALSEAATKVLLGVPVGALLQTFWRPPAASIARWMQRIVFVAAAGLLFAIIEVGQMFLPTRYPDSTDVLLGVLGACVGIASVMVVLTAWRPLDGSNEPGRRQLEAPSSDPPPHAMGLSPERERNT